VHFNRPRNRISVRGMTPLILAALVIAILVGIIAFRKGVRRSSAENRRMAQELIERSAAIAEERQKLELATDALVGGVLTLDARDRLLSWNEAATEVLDWVAPPTQGMMLSEVVRLSGILELVDVARRDWGATTREVAAFKDGKERTLTAHAFPMSRAGLMLIVSDSTRIRQLEKTRQEFVLNASHELKTPLTAIKGYADTLRSGGMDEETRRHFTEKLSANVNRLMALTEDLLNLSRIESRQGPPPRSEFDCRPLVKNAVDRYAIPAQQKEVELAVEVPNVPVSVLSHASSMEQILNNLLDNAIKYSKPSGQVRVTLTAENGEARIDVTDSGIGIPKSDLDHIFERFYRVDRARSISEGGTGLGLSIVKHLVSQLKGRIEVTSDLGRGSRFVLHLPRN
jgi:two-component system, OmpR family, phosphate regulon sensor histidine kinase PhoR